ncbi:MAG TPA: bifunctional transaldolase/phosoglucose isomerase [Dehalococcoidia bacterium]|nr:bifunctional transaldolase/phosoglucose isomerase [Dehalococcoidia bacterium]
MAAKKLNPLQQLAVHGQGFWYDNIRRKFLQDGTLAGLRDNDGLRGVTANPTIFQHAIAAGDDYDDQIREMARKGADPNAIYERLATDDVRTACDILRPVYDATHGEDGFVSLEVAPGLARDTDGTIKEVKRFWQIVNRPNLMVKIPATREGVPAIEHCLTEGININITLIFAVERYIDVARAYVRALRLRATRGQPVDRIASVASFFVSRVDTKVDKMLDEKIAAAKGEQKRELEALKGKAAIANAKIAYEDFKKIFYGDEFRDLREKGARVQRPLWASTSTKNPAYRDVMYVEDLIGRDTVDTMPPQTIDAFRDHGVVADTLDTGLAEAHEAMRRLARAGISMTQVTQELEDEGVASFSASIDELFAGIAAKSDVMRANLAARQSASLGAFERKVDGALAAAEKSGAAGRVWKKDATYWKPNAKPDDQELSGWLGWLTAPEAGLKALDDLNSFVEEVRQEGFSDAVVLGMGGSSLAPLVFAETFGKREGYPRLHVLDSTDPANVLAVQQTVNLPKTLFIVSSKSGSTTEPNTFHAYFWEQVKRAGVQEPGKQFVAITDPGSSLEAAAKQQGFRRVFYGDPEIGGRYSALSPFGLVPAALAGVDVKTLLERAHVMAEACAGAAAPSNPGLWLGTILGTLAQNGHDKVTFLASPKLSSFGLWGEQLLAESTGKEGRGLIPIATEAPGKPADYGADRLFALIELKGNRDAALERKVKALEAAGQPVVRLTLNDALDLGAEMFRWEFATAVAGSILGINPFDQPNVQESKDNTKRLLAEFETKGSLTEPDPTARRDGLALTAGTSNGARAGGANGASGEHAFAETLAGFLKGVKPGDYLAIMAYLPYDEAIEHELQKRRIVLRDALKVATTLGYGPRFLHSTGQLHKGGPNSGVFVQITATAKRDAPVPGEKYSFAVLEAAQALGDLQSLEKHGRRALRLHIDGDVVNGLAALTESLTAVK